MSSFTFGLILTQLQKYNYGDSEDTLVTSINFWATKAETPEEEALIKVSVFVPDDSELIIMKLILGNLQENRGHHRVSSKLFQCQTTIVKIGSRWSSQFQPHETCRQLGASYIQVNGENKK